MPDDVTNPDESDLYGEVMSGVVAVSALEGQSEGSGAAEELPARYPAGTLVAYSARWVPVARIVAKILDEVRASKISVVEVDMTTDRPGLPEIVVLPTFIYWDQKGPRVKVGAASAVELIDWCKSAP